jgi:hypothetical protein
MTKDTREAFEKWYSKEFSHVWHSQIGPEDTNHYESQFDCWKAATRAAEAEIERLKTETMRLMVEYGNDTSEMAAENASLRADLAVAVEVLAECRQYFTAYSYGAGDDKSVLFGIEEALSRLTNNVAR